MARKKYSLIKGGSKEIEISWGFAWKNFTVRQNGQIIGTIGTQKELKEGRQFKLSDSTIFSVKLNVGLNLGLEVLHDGKPLPGYDSGPAQKKKTAFIILLIVAIINMLGGIAIAALINEFIIFGSVIFIFGLLFMGLSIGVKKRLMSALIISIVLLIIDAVSSITFLIIHQNNMSLVWVFIRVLFIIFLIQAIMPMKELKQKNIE